MPEGAVYVGRPSRWGNPFTWRGERVHLYVRQPNGRRAWQTMIGPARRPDPHRDNERLSPTELTNAFASYAVERLSDETHWLDDIRGHDLACWCPLGQPCHADVLLELANPV